MNDLLWATPDAPGLSHANNAAVGQTTERMMRQGARFDDDAGRPVYTAPQPSGPFYIYANATARAAVLEDSTRIATSNGGFLTSAIPVPGNMFFGAPPQNSMSASGSIVDLNATNQSASGGGAPATAMVNARFALNNATIGNEGAAPFRRGQYVQANLQRTRPFTIANEPSQRVHHLQYGIECIYGHKEALNGNHGHDHRLLFVHPLTK